MEVLVLGAGPAGLLAAWAALKANAQVTIYDTDIAYRPDRIFSLQYMHLPCDVPDVKELKLHYKAVRGTSGGEIQSSLQYEKMSRTYRDMIKRMYNDKLGRPLDEENSTRFLFETPTQVWSLKSAYFTLHTIMSNSLQCSVERVWPPLKWIDLADLAKQFDLVVSTVPLDKLRPDLTWPVRTGWVAMDWTPPEFKLDNDTCLYNLQAKDPWYRATNLDGGKATEFIRVVEGWPETFKQRGWNDVALQELRKVADNTALSDLRKLETLPANLLFTGRWGSWNPKALTHQAFFDTEEMIKCL